MKKRITALCLSVLCFFSLTAEASVLGSKQIYGYTYEIGDGLYFNKNRFLSDQNGVGNQTENFFEYLPNSATRPVVTLGKYVYGGEDINEIYEYLTKSGVRTVGGTNGDFFSMATGVPSGHVVINKKIVSTDERVLPALGIRADGSAFIDDFQIVTKMYHNGTETVMPYINKYLQKWNYYMYDSDFYSSIKPSALGKYVTLQITGGEMALGGVLTTKVVSIEDAIADKPLSDGQIVIALTYEADPALAEVFESFLPDDVVEFTFNSNNNELWCQAEHILASEAGQIVKNGAYVGKELGGASPRTAVGIAADGRMILYTVDGRQQGHSYGVRIPTLANRMKELGCTDVLNLDGGGSTAISAMYGGTGNFELQNSPSDGRLRNDSTYIFFENVTPYTGAFEKLFMYPQTIYAKSGSTVQYTLKGADSGYFPAELPSNAVYTVEGSSYADDLGMIHAVGDETAVVTASVNGISAKAYLKSIETPDYIKITDSSGNPISSLNMNEGETVDLNVIAYYNDMPISSTDSAYGWEVSDGTGTITPDGVFTMGEYGGEITVTSGNSYLKIPVSGGTPDAFSDISENWARHYINELYEKGVVNGYSENNEFKFKPLNLVTKSETAVMISRALGLNTQDFSNTALPYADLSAIPDWALPHVKVLYAKGIMKGSLSNNGKTYFYPTSTVNRAEIFTIAGRILGAESASPCPFADRDEFPSWAVGYIDALYEKGMINGYSDNTLKAGNSITRAEISKIIVKALY